MPGTADFSGRGLSREEEILARVVIDLGLAKPDTVSGIVDTLAAARSQGHQVKLGDALREKGCLNPRFAAVVEKVVRARLGDGGAAALTPGPSAAATPGEAPAPAPRPRADAPAANAAPDAEGKGAPVFNAPQRVYRDAPQGEGFSTRSRKDVKSAWAAYHKGGKVPEKGAGAAPAAPPAPVAQPEAPPAPTAVQGRAEATSTPEDAAPDAREMRPSAASEPRKPLFPVTPRAPGSPAVADRLVPPTSGLGKQPEAPRKSFTPRFKRGGRASGHTESIDVASLKEELKITGRKEDPEDAGDGADAVPTDTRRKEIALQAFIKRVIPGTLHQQCLEVVLRKRLNYIPPARLAEETGCKEREARRVLDDWKAAGIARQDDPTVYQYVIAPSKADLALIREFLTRWNDPMWHQKLLAWILEAQG